MSNNITLWTNDDVRVEYDPEFDDIEITSRGCDCCSGASALLTFGTEELEKWLTQIRSC